MSRAGDESNNLMVRICGMLRPVVARVQCAETAALSLRLDLLPALNVITASLLFPQIVHPSTFVRLMTANKTVSVTIEKRLEKWREEARTAHGPGVRRAGFRTLNTLASTAPACSCCYASSSFQSSTSALWAAAPSQLRYKYVWGNGSVIQSAIRSTKFSTNKHSGGQ